MLGAADRNAPGAGVDVNGSTTTSMPPPTGANSGLGRSTSSGVCAEREQEATAAAVAMTEPSQLGSWNVGFLIMFFDGLIPLASRAGLDISRRMLLAPTYALGRQARLLNRKRIGNLSPELEKFAGC